MKTVTNLELGNNESLSRGIFQETDGTYTAMTFTQSKNFKTKRGAELWLANKLSK